MKDEEIYYKRVYIRSEADLPKGNGMYFCMDKDRKYIGDRSFEKDDKIGYRIWRDAVDWYLLPISQPELSREKVIEVLHDYLDGYIDNTRIEDIASELYSDTGQREKIVICDGCNVRKPFEHRCHGEGCNCDNPVCMEYQGRITHEQLMDIVNGKSKPPSQEPNINTPFFGNSGVKIPISQEPQTSAEEKLANSIPIFDFSDAEYDKMSKGEIINWYRKCHKMMLHYATCPTDKAIIEKQKKTEKFTNFPNKEGCWLRLNAGHRLEVHNVFKIPKRKGLFIVWGFGGEQDNCNIMEIRNKLERFNWIYFESELLKLKDKSKL